MTNGADSKYRSRKFIFAAGSFLAATAMAFFGCVVLAKDAGDIAMVIGAWGVANALVLKLYNDANLKAGGGV